MNNDDNTDEMSEYFDFLFNSPETEKVLYKINNRLYIKYPKIIKNNKKLFEIKFEQRILFQDEINLLLMDIIEYNKIPLYRKIINRIKFIYRNIGQWKIIIYINNIEYKIFFFGIKKVNYNSKYCEYNHEVMPDNYKIIDGDDKILRKKVKNLIKKDEKSNIGKNV